MRSLRLDDSLERRLQKAAAAEGTSVSEFIRRAADERAAKTLSDETSDRLADVIAAVRTSGGRARNSGKVFADALADRRRSK